MPSMTSSLDGFCAGATACPHPQRIAACARRRLLADARTPSTTSSAWAPSRSTCAKWPTAPMTPTSRPMLRVWDIAGIAAGTVKVVWEGYRARLSRWDGERITSVTITMLVASNGLIIRERNITAAVSVARLHQPAIIFDFSGSLGWGRITSARLTEREFDKPKEATAVPIRTTSSTAGRDPGRRRPRHHAGRRPNRVGRPD